MTNDNNIPFLGTDGVRIENGVCVPLSHLGNSILHIVSKPLLLSNVLHTPQANDNLVFIHKLCCDNDVFIEFYSYLFFVKDKYTKKVLLHSPLDYGLYKILANTAAHKTVSTVLDFSSASLITSIWYEHLGHTSHPIVHIILT